MDSSAIARNRSGYSKTTITAIGMLSAVNMLNYLDRAIFGLLVEPIKADLSLSDTQIGVLTGFAFAVLYVAAGIPLARIADTGNRIRLLSVCLFIWSLATALCGVATNFFHLVVARILVGFGEAGGNPTSQSLLGDIIEPKQR
ncbi:MAG: MFS transporter, partial [Phycisphaerales bacterium]|nr:MFS transporter [Phycisphaerales bacterium]